MAKANWLGGVANPFALPVPPAGFLRELAAFDPDLVLYPSQQEFFYRLARRAHRTGGLMSALSSGTDAAVCVQHRLVPVTSIRGDAHFGPAILQWLRDRDTWAFGGAKKVNAILEAQDKHQARTRQRDRDSENDARARSMWRTYARRTGQSVALNDVHRGRGQQRSKHDVRNRTPRPHSAPAPLTPAPSGWTASGSGLVLPPT